MAYSSSGKTKKAERVGTSDFEELVKTYVESFPEEDDSKIVCLNDKNEVVYFLTFENKTPDADPLDESYWDETPIQHADVAIFDPKKNEYTFVPYDTGFKLAMAFLSYSEARLEAYAFLDEQSEENEL